MRSGKSNTIFIILFLGFFFLSCGKSDNNLNGGSNNNSNEESSHPESSDGPAQETDVELKVMTFNIRHGAPFTNNVSDKIDIDRFAEVINFEKPDLVALQEVDSFTTRAPMDQTKELGELTGMEYKFFKTFDYQGGKFGVAILSKHPILSSENIRLPFPVETSEVRTFGMATIRVSDKERINFATTHLDVLKENRVAQVNKIAELANQSLYPLIIGGDFNATFGSDEINQLEDVYTFTCSSRNCPYTIPSTKPNKTIDFIMLNQSAADKFEVMDFGIIETEASDHLPYVATLGLE